MDYDIKCPHCGQGQDICHDDGQGYDEGETHVQECVDCNKEFFFITRVSRDYYPCDEEGNEIEV